MTAYQPLGHPRTVHFEASHAMLSKLLAWVLQRLPFMSHVAMVILCGIGPVFTPHLLAFFLVFVHIVFVCCQSRTAYGVYACWKGTRAHSRRDWQKYYEGERIRMESEGEGHHIIAIKDVQHIVIVPAYKEDVSTLRETLDVLASHPLSSQCYHVCLGMEERETGASVKAQDLVDYYRNKGAFCDVTYSLHPGNIIGESAGKSSNVNWATRHMYHRRNMSTLRSIYTIMDADTAFASDFFLASAVHFALAQPMIRKRMMFIPPTLFDRNSPDVPIFTRATDIFWSCAGIGGIYPASSVKIPTSAYGVSMQLAHFCDFWDAGPEAIGEDLHFYCKAMFETRGNVHAVTIYSPASQCNVVGKAGKGPVSSYVNDMLARWTQATRHLWGSLDFGYCWHRILTGQFGRSRPKEGYIAINTDEMTQDGHKLVLDEPGCSRTPSPSVTATTSDSDDMELGGNIVLPRARKITSFSHIIENGKTNKQQQQQQQLTLPVVDIKVVKQNKDEFLDEEDAAYYEEDDEDDLGGETETLRLFPIIVLMTRLYEAHLMIAQVFLMGFLTTLYPSVLFRNGTVSFTDPYNRACTVSECMLSIFESPFAAGVDLAENTPPGLHPSWMMPTILICAGKAARFLGAGGIIATITVCILHDCYHHCASHTRWINSDLIYKEWIARGSRGSSNIDPAQSPLLLPPARYLGIRAHQSCRRQWPSALLDFAAIPAGLLYGIAPLLYAQLCHLVTNRLTYTVSAKSKTIIAIPTGGSAVVNSTTPRRSAERVRASMEMTRIIRDEKLQRS